MSVNIQTSDGLVKIAGTPTIDTSFSNISKNPVQNNVITQKFEQIDSQIRTQNSNLDGLEYSEIAGGKNLVDVSKATKGYWLDSSGKLNASAGNNVTDYIEVSDNVMISGCVGNSASFCWFDSNKAYISGFSYGGDSTKTGTKPSNAKYIRASFTDTNANSFMIELGDSVTQYEPYIPSVKMLADEVNAQNESLESQGLLNKFDNQYKDGFYETDGKFYVNPQWKSTKNAMGVSSGDILSVNFIGTPTYARVVFFDGNNTFVSSTNFDKNIKAKVTTPSGATKYFISFFPNTVTVDSIYINNAIDELKNDLGGLSVDCNNCQTLYDIINLITKTNICGIGLVGDSVDTNIKTLLGSPNMGNYVEANIMRLNNISPIWEIVAIMKGGTNVKTGYIYNNDNTWVWTGWK